MTGQERVNRYIEILDKEGKVNSSRNWGIFDKLSDDELSDDLKITECIKIINKCDKRMENNPNKYPEEIMRIVRQRFNVNKYEDLIDSVINKMKPDEVFTAVCNCNGLTGYANKIKL